MSRRGGAASFALPGPSAFRVALASAMGLAALLFVPVFAPTARADTWSEVGDKGPNDPKLNERTTRNGLVVGLSLGVGAAGGAGYPNASSDIGDPNYYSSSNLLLGTGSKLFVLGAVADYVNFGAWFGSDRGDSKDWKLSAGGGGLRVELFPLFVVVPSLKNLGVLLDFGIGSGTLTAKTGDYPQAHGVSSFLGGGLFYEWTIFHALGGHAALGPSVEFDGVYSQAIATDTFLVGGRFAFYGGM